MSLRIVVIDDSAAMRGALAEALTACLDARVDVADTAGDGLALLEREPADLVLLDVRLHGSDSMAACRLIRARPDAPPVVMLSAHAEEDYARQATAAGAVLFVQKSDGLAAILDAVERLTA